MNNETLNSVAYGYSSTGTTSNINWADYKTSTIGTINDRYVCKDDFDTKMNELTRKPEVRPDTTTKLDTKNGKIYVKHYKDGFFKSERAIMSDIKDVEVYDKTVIVTFVDNTKTVAVLDMEDEFNLEQGISICITKKLLGENGSSIYNKLIKKAFKVKEQNEKAAEKAKKTKAEEKQRRELALARHKKKQAKKREEQISMYTEAFTRAMKAIGGKCKCGKNK